VTGRWLLPVLVPPLAAGVARALRVTLRVRTTGLEALRALTDEPVIFAAWHGRTLMLPLINTRLRSARGDRPVRVLASRSLDGEMLAGFVRAFGLGVVRGSSSRGGAAALRVLVAALRDGYDVAVAPDVPRGPARRVQPGVVMLAATTGAPIVPLAFGARPGRRLKSWDACLVPAPFARCAYVFGPALHVARHVDREVARRALETALDEVTAAADELTAA
jgi:lysophospholipid acyltransferase (LPLAT)-like uncharacterized protein